MHLLDPHYILTTFGVVAIFIVLVAETGLLVGIVLPGDSLLFSAGLLCATTRAGTHLSLPLVLIWAVAGALLGAQIGYVLGRRGGDALLRRSRRPRLAEAVERTRVWFDRYGPAKAIVLARFVPVVRTLINPLAGVIRVPSRTFVISQVGGGLVWTVGVTFAGYLLGKRIPNVDKYLMPIIAVVVVVSLLPMALELVRARQRNQQESTR